MCSHSNFDEYFGRCEDCGAECLHAHTEIQPELYDEGDKLGCLDCGEPIEVTDDNMPGNMPEARDAQ